MESKGVVCVTGGTGYLASWLIMKLLQKGYHVNTTIRFLPDCTRDISYLKDLPGASERLRIFTADLNEPDSFEVAIKGCCGVFHTAHPVDLGYEEMDIKKFIDTTLAILQACNKSETVKRVVWTSSISAAAFNSKATDIIDEGSWTDVDLIRRLSPSAGSYIISKTLTERTALEFAQKHGLDIVTILPTWIHGPFLGPRCPISVHVAMAMIFGDRESYKYIQKTSFVHIDDVCEAHIFLFEYPQATGRYICSAVETTTLSEFLSARYPEYQLPNIDSLKDVTAVKLAGLSSKKLIEAGFKYKYGLEEMFDEAIECCKQKGFL